MHDIKTSIVLSPENNCNLHIFYLLGFGHHHVRLKEGFFYFIAKTLDDRVAEREIGHKVTIHHIQVQVIGAVVEQLLRLLVKLRQVGVQDRRADFRVQTLRSPRHVVWNVSMGEHVSQNYKKVYA